MYIPKPFDEPNVSVMHELIQAHPLATLVTLSSSGLNANHIPFYLSTSPEPYGVLRGHVARANPMLDDLRTSQESLVIFHGPNAYISPSWYATKKETGKVVPTWNYAVVHARGTIRVVEDTDWLRDQLESLTRHNEASFAEPWTLADAPTDFTDKIMKAIVGIEMVVTDLSGKWKVSQNQPANNQASLVAGLKQSDQPNALAIATLVESRSK